MMSKMIKMIQIRWSFLGTSQWLLRVPALSLAPLGIAFLFWNLSNSVTSCAGSTPQMWRSPKVKGTPKSSILMTYSSSIDQTFWGSPIYGKPWCGSTQLPWPKLPLEVLGKRQRLLPLDFPLGALGIIFPHFGDQLWPHHWGLLFVLSLVGDTKMLHS